MNEAEFVRRIDCNFPYGNPKKSRQLARQSLRISPNAVFMVYSELARPGRGVRCSQEARFALVDYLDERFVHPLSGIASLLTRKMIAKQFISPARAAVLAKIIAKFPGCYNVLNLAYFSCDDKLEKNESLFEAIRKRWERMPNKTLNRIFKPEV